MATSKETEKENGKGNVVMQKPPIVSQQEWEAARQQLLVKEKALTRSRDALAAERRRMPWMAVEKKYEFAGPAGKMEPAGFIRGPAPVGALSRVLRARSFWLARTCMPRLLFGRGSGRAPGTFERARYYARVCITRTAGGYRAAESAHGMGNAVVHDDRRLR